MLTALDFMDGLLYSAEGIWLRDDGAGSVRLGLNSYAAFGGDADVYFVKLPKRGARIVRGESFGHVDLGRRTVPLLSPVTGAVLFPNTDLRGEPQLLARDPYGRGYLLEVEGVARAEVDELLERDDAALRSPVAGSSDAPFSAEQLIERGRPWASRVELRVGGEALVRGRIMPPFGNDVFTPDWVAGERWTVESRSKGVVRRFRFEVLGASRVGGDEVTTVRVVELAGAGSAPPRFERRIHYRVTDHSLAAWDEVSLDDPLALRRHWNPRGREAWILVGEAADGFLLDHPRFPVSLDDESRDIPAGATKAEPAISHYVRFRGGLTRLEADLRADIPREDGQGTERLLVTFIFERGEPWWTEAVRTLGEEVLTKAKLVKE